MNEMKTLKIMDTGERKGVVQVGKVRFGKGLVLMAGPYGVEENEGRMLAIAQAAGRAGADLLRGAVLNPLPRPYSQEAQGRLNLRALGALEKAKKATGLPLLVEVMNPRDIESVGRCADMLQVEANMRNSELLSEVGTSGMPALLKHGFGSTLGDLLKATELLGKGNSNIVLCTGALEHHTGLDIWMMPALKRLRLPVMMDASTSLSNGNGNIAESMSLATASGADGVIMTVNYEPDGALGLRQFIELMGDLRQLSLKVAQIRSEAGVHNAGSEPFVVDWTIG
ncbi:MAG: 3-deoxy-7-phosphoheptulonate synthase [Candidatus Micrarchaeia archaeon]